MLRQTRPEIYQLINNIPQKDVRAAMREYLDQVNATPQFRDLFFSEFNLDDFVDGQAQVWAELFTPEQAHELLALQQLPIIQYQLSVATKLAVGLQVKADEYVTAMIERILPTFNPEAL